VSLADPPVTWWAAKVRQFARHLTGRVAEAERIALRDWLTPAQQDLFASMHRADQRHGLDVLRSLRERGHDQPELLLAGLLHDCGKGRWVTVWHRVGWSLGQRYGRRVRRLGERLPGFGRAYANLDGHAARSAELAMLAGCNELTVELIRRQHEPTDTPLGEALRLADEAN
jgi:hypothetical protein